MLEPPSGGSQARSGDAQRLAGDPREIPIARPPVLAAQELAQLPLDATMPLTPEVRSGRFPNGMRYFIRKNTEPAGRVELRFVVDVGSVLERDEERGLAHFMEHMLFNGTDRFPGGDVMAFLQAAGTFNAYTTYDETVCLVKVPTDDERVLAVTFDIVQDWATAVTLDPAEVDAERGVIVEERRLRTLSAGGRAADEVRSLYLNGSRYAERSPIGTLDVIRTAPRERLVEFYRTWYRPENMAVIVVGDVEPAAIEAMIVDRFAALQNPEAPAIRPLVEVPRNDDPVYSVLSDPEQPLTEVTVGWKRPAPELRTVGSYRDFLTYQLFDRIMNLRLLEAGQAEGSPLVQASAGRSLMVRTLEVWSAAAVANEGRADEALEALLTEVERVRRFGFTPAEFERAKQDVATSYARAAAEKINTPSESLANELVRHVTTDEPVPGIAAERALATRFLPQITLEDLNREARRLGSKNRVVIVHAPQKDGLVPPTEAELAAAVARVDDAEIEPYEDALAGTELMEEPPAPGAITSRRTLTELGITELVLENGARVLYKPTEIREQEVLFSASSPGGASLVPDDDYAEASLAARIVAESGVGDFSRLDLLKVLSGREVLVLPTIDDYFEGMQGQARPDDLEALFQLAHLYFTRPREDPAALERVRTEYIARLENLRAVPEMALEEAVNRSLYGETVRAGLLPLKEIADLDPERVYSIYRERFADAGDFTFSFVGNFEPDEIEALAQRYLATLPARDGGESYEERLQDPPDQVVTRTVRSGKEDRSRVRILFEGDLSRIQPQTYMLATALKRALGERLMSDLRESRGAVYDVLTQVDVYEVPQPSYRVTLDFTTAPRQVDELIAAVFENLDRVRTGGPSDFSVAMVRESERRDREEALESNGFWLGTLERIAKLPDYDPSEVLRFDELFGALNAEDVRDFAQQVLPEDRYIQVVLQPEVEIPSAAE